MIDELSQTVVIAEGDLGESTAKLSKLEEQVGADLGDLRNMELSATGDSDLRRRLNNIEDELRQARAQNRSNEELRKLLIVSQDSPGNLLATPGRLLISQPALERLKTGLVAAQLRTSQLRGKMTELHPHVIAARMEEKQIAVALHDEVAVAIRGVDVDLRLTNDRVAFLRGEGQGLRDRLTHLAGMRPRYSTVLTEVKHRTDALANVRGKLAAAKAAKAGAQTASLITFVDTPILGDQPVGPRRAMILLVGIFGGLATGFGIVFLTVPSRQPSQAIVIEPHVDRAHPERPAGIRRVPVERTPGLGSKA